MQPDFADARYNLAIAMYQANQRESAELELRKSFAAPFRCGHSLCTGTDPQGQGDPGARLEFETALKLDPASGVARHELERLR